MYGWGRIVLYWLARNNTKRVSGNTKGGEEVKRATARIIAAARAKV